jgi:parallel beta-helix repeat protein
MNGSFSVIAAAVLTLSVSVLHADEVSENDPVKVNELQTLILAAVDSDTIDVPLAEYSIYSTLILTGLNDVCIRFEPGSEVLLNNTELNVLTLMSCSNVQVLNGYFRHTEPLDYYDCHGSVIVLESCSNITFDNCTVNGCGAMGFVIEDCEDISVLHCLIEDNSFTAFYLMAYNDLDINHCLIRNNGSLFFSSGQLDQTDLHMRNNVIYGNTCVRGDSLETPGLRNCCESIQE